MNIEPLEPSPISPLTDEQAMRWISRGSNNRPRLETEETLRATNGKAGARDGNGGAHHIHTMSEENPFLPTDDEIDGDDGSDVSSVSNDSVKRFQNWVAHSPARKQQMCTPFVPPREIVIIVKNEAKGSAETVPDWLKLPLRNPSSHGPPPAAFKHAKSSSPDNNSPVMMITDSPRTATHPFLSPCDHVRNMSWATETTTTSMSLHRVSSQEDSVPVGAIVDRPRRTHHRGFSQPISVGSLVGQSSLLAGGSSLASTAGSSSLSLSGDSFFSHTRRANRKLDDLVASPRTNNRRVNPLKEEVLYMFDKVSGPVKRLVKTHHHRSKSLNLHASEHGCLT